MRRPFSQRTPDLKMIFVPIKWNYFWRAFTTTSGFYPTFWRLENYWHTLLGGYYQVHPNSISFFTINLQLIFRQVLAFTCSTSPCCAWMTSKLDFWRSAEKVRRLVAPKTAALTPPIADQWLFSSSTLRLSSSAVSTAGLKKYYILQGNMLKATVSFSWCSSG